LIPLSAQVKAAKNWGMDYVTAKENLGYEDMSPEYLSKVKEAYMKDVNPTGEVPTLGHNGNFIFESEIVSEYIANVFNKNLRVEDPYQIA